MNSSRGESWYHRFLRPKVMVDAIGWMLLAGLPFVIHAYQVADVPSVAEPFDVASFEEVQVAPEDNAWFPYRQAARQVVPMSTAAKEEYDNTFEEGAAAIGESLTGAIRSNQTALNLFLEGSKRTGFQRTRDEASAIQSDDINSSLRELVRLTEAQALILLQAGDVESAWDHLHANLRCGRHLGQNSDSNGRLIGRAFHVCGIRRIARWAESPLVDTPLLRRALDDIRATYAMTPPISTALKFDYLYCRSICNTPALQDSGMNQQNLRNRLEWEGRWFLGEPELSRTVLRAAFSNWLSECDRLPCQRSPRTDWGLFSRAPVATGSASMISADAIDHLILRSLVARPLVCTEPYVFTSLDSEVAWQAILELLLATQIHYRETGAFPASADELVGTTLDALPIDPFGLDPTGRVVPIGYRREAESEDGATIWSIGPDGIDDAGKLKYPASIGRDSERGDVLITIKPPRE